MVKLNKSFAWKEHKDFLSDYAFKLVLDEDGDSFSCTVVENKDILLAFTYQRGLGKNFMVAERGSPLEMTSIAARDCGWSLISEVWPQAHDRYNQARKKLSYPHKLSEDVENQIIDEMLRSFVEKVCAREVVVGEPKHRIDS